MKEYYIAVDGQQKGAFSLKDLKRETVLPDTLMWKEGWDNWQKAKDAAKTIPEIDLIINDVPPIPQEGRAAPKSKKSLLTTLAKASEGDLASIGSLVGIGDDNNAEEKNEGGQEQQQKAKVKPSFTDTVYHVVGNKIDEYLDANQSEIGSNSLVTNLDKVRTYYKGLSVNRQRSFSFLVSAAVIYLSFTLFFLLITDSRYEDAYSDFTTPFWFVCIWSTTVALNQIKYFDKAANQITNLAFLLDFGLMPAQIKQGIARFAKTLLFLVIGLFTAYYIGLPYLIYRIVIAFVDPDNMPNFEK